MQKTLLRNEPLPPTKSPWLDLSGVASVEISSEDSLFPIEAALLEGREGGWRATEYGEQVIRLVFAAPQRVQRIEMLFVEEELERVQQFVLRWKPENSDTYRDILRQQFVFSPGGATRETENYIVDLMALKELELRITPDIGGKETLATLRRFRIA